MVERQSARALPVPVIRYGVDRPLPERLPVQAGPLSGVLEGSFLRYLAIAGEEVLRGIYVAVRDHNWGTVEPRFTAYDVRRNDDSFQVRFRAEHVDPEVDFAWEGAIDGTPDGVLVYTMDGVARKTFLRNRIGFCVLHPAALAGTPLEVETPRGLVQGTLPRPISPHQPFRDIVALRQRFPSGAGLEVRFEGDLFEMEDQRNWTDASFKTYCTPLSRPIPVEIREGTRLRQSVTLRTVSQQTAPLAPLRDLSPGPSPKEGGERLPDTSPATSPLPLGRGLGGRSVPFITLSLDRAGTLPLLGLGMASHGQPLAGGEIDCLALLRPAHLRAMLLLGDPRWPDELTRAAEDALALDAALELEVVAAGDQGEGLDRLADTLRRRAEMPPIARLLVFPRSGVVSTAPVLARARDAFAGSGIDAPIGGGTRADFVDLNRAPPPAHLLDVAGFAVNPQVHAFDNGSLVETLPIQGATVENVRRLVPARPIAAGPVTLKPRLNPAATAAERPTAPGALPPRVDPRQMSLFAAAWTVGSLRHLAAAGAASITYFETTGRLGVMEQTGGWTEQPGFHSWPGMLFPVFHVLADAGDFAGAGVLRVEVSDPLRVEALALRAGDSLRLLVANLTPHPLSVAVQAPPLDHPTLRLLDETTALLAASDGDAFRQAAGDPLPAWSAPLGLALRPYAVARLDGRLPPGAVST